MSLEALAKTDVQGRVRVWARTRVHMLGGGGGVLVSRSGLSVDILHSGTMLGEKEAP